MDEQKAKDNADEVDRTHYNLQLRKLAATVLLERSPLHDRLFASAHRALATSTALLVLMALLYLLVLSVDLCNDPCEADESIFHSSITVDAQTLDIEFNEFELSKILSVDDIDKSRAALEKKYGKRRNALLNSRIVVANICHDVFDGRLSATFLASDSVAMSLIVHSPAEEWVKYSYPIGLADRLKKIAAPASLSDQTYLDAPSALEEYRLMEGAVAMQADKENAYIDEVRGYIAGMEPHVSFEWLLAIPWYVQLIFWTVFGVIINNIVWLIRGIKQRQEDTDLPYSSGVYVAFFARLVIAPFISIIFLAMVSAGIASFDITNLNNLPAFLVAAFFLGFMSEAVTLRIRQFFNQLVDSIQTHKQRDLTLADIEPVPEFVPQKNDSLANLIANMKGLVNTEVSELPIRNKMIKNNKLDK